MSRSVPVLRHPTLGVAMPWLDVRVVPPSTMMEYLGCDDDRLRSLARSGCFAEPGCTREVGDTRPITYYVPARVWAVNGWTPGADVQQVLAARPDQSALAALAEQLATLGQSFSRLLAGAHRPEAGTALTHRVAHPARASA